MPIKPQMTLESLKKAVTYDPLTRIFVRNAAAGNTKAGSPVGNLDSKGYLKAMVCLEMVKLHRLAWLYTHGVWPEGQIDHINHIKTDNRILNLRVCNTSENCLNQLGPRSNNKAGFQGVHVVRKTGRYRACLQGKHLGVFPTAEDAHNAYRMAKQHLIPEVVH